MAMEIFYGLGTAILALAIVWALLRVGRRNRANDVVGDIAAREQYRNPEGYDPDKFRAHLKPKH
jgi:hypothetical protein